MDFELNEEQRMAQQMVRDFVQKEVAPVIKEADRAQEMAGFILPRMGELGIWESACLPATAGRGWITSPWGWLVKSWRWSTRPCGW